MCYFDVELEFREYEFAYFIKKFLWMPKKWGQGGKAIF
jgi:hypothetical protein